MLVSAISLAVDPLSAGKPMSARREAPSRTAMATDNVQISDLGRSLLTAGAHPGDSASAVMSRFDLRNIAYTDLVNLAGELRDIGALKPEDYLDFIGPSPEFGSLTGETVTGWNEPKDYVAMHEQNLAFMRESGAESRFIDFEHYRLSLFQHFQSLRSQS